MAYTTPGSVAPYLNQARIAWTRPTPSYALWRTTAAESYENTVPMRVEWRAWFNCSENSDLCAKMPLRVYERTCVWFVRKVGVEMKSLADGDKKSRDDEADSSAVVEVDGAKRESVVHSTVSVVIYKFLHILKICLH